MLAGGIVVGGIALAQAQLTPQAFSDYIARLGAASSLSASDGVPIVQNGVVKKWLPYNYFLDHTASNVADLAAARRNLSIPDGSTRTPWSTLGVVANGTTDNTAALNALPANTPIEADCPRSGGVIRLDGPWILKSNLDIKFQPGCTIVSYVSGSGSYAITQTDLTTPLTNVTLDGLNIQKNVTASGERILRAYINHFKLLNWRFTVHGGAMFLRGSCQEIAYGFSTTTDLTTGSSGIRHAGNVPKVVDACDQPADVWVHNDVVISGDAAYQSCQPQTSTWTNVSSDDFLWERNTGLGSAFALIGNDQVGAFNAYTCNKITYRNNSGGGRERGVLFASNGAPVTNVTYVNQDFDMINSSTNDGAILVRGADAATGGVFEKILLDGVNVWNTNIQGLVVDVRAGIGGSLDGFVYRNGTIDTPRNATGGGAWQPTVTINGGANVTLANSVIHGAGVGSTATLNVGFDDGASDPRTVTNLRLLNNLIDKVPANSTAVFLKNATAPVASGNVIRRTSGAASVTGFRVRDSYALPTSGTGPGTTDASLINNTVNDLATPIVWTCNSGAANVAQSNLGDAGRICP